MTTEQNTQTVLRAKFRAGIWLLLLFLSMIVDASITFPFVGHTTKIQNVTFGLLVSMPFWISVIVYLVFAYRDISLCKEEE